MNANPTIAQTIQLLVFNIEMIMGLRQTFMTLMLWAIDVPQKQVYKVRLITQAIHKRLVQYEL